MGLLLRKNSVLLCATKPYISTEGGRLREQETCIYHPRWRHKSSSRVLGTETRCCMLYCTINIAETRARKLHPQVHRNIPTPPETVRMWGALLLTLLNDMEISTARQTDLLRAYYRVIWTKSKPVAKANKKLKLKNKSIPLITDVLDDIIMWCSPV